MQYLLLFLAVYNLITVILLAYKLYVQLELIDLSKDRKVLYRLRAFHSIIYHLLHVIAFIYTCFQLWK